MLPAGSHLTGKVTVAHQARSFHRAGQLRFSFQTVELAPAVARLTPTVAERASLNRIATVSAAEPNGKVPLKVDSEGTVKAQERKTRFIAPVISFLIASRAMDDDAGRHPMNGPANANTGPRTLAGASGFGMLGAAAAQLSPAVGSVLGFYGLGWSVYSNIIARGNEVRFPEML